MRVLLINNFHYQRSGAERAYFDEGKILSEAGHKIAYFSTRNEKNEPTPWSKYFVSYYDFQDKHNMAARLKIISRIFWNFEAARKLKKMIEEFRPEVAHLHNIYHHLSPSVIRALKRSGVPVVMTLHDYKLISPNYNLFVRGKIWEAARGGRYWRAITDRAVKDSLVKSLICAAEAYFHRLIRIYDQVDAFISPSKFLAGKFKEFGFKKEINYLPNPLLDIPEAEGGEAGDYILYAGRLSPEKGVDDLIAAFAKAETGKRLLIAGDGPDREKLEKMAVDFKAADRIKFLGHRPKDELFELARKSRFVVIPSKWPENAPYSVLETMALTKAVVCAKVGGISDMVEDKENGLFFEAGNVGELSEIIGKMCRPESDNLLDEMGKKAWTRALKLGDRDEYYGKLMKIFDNLKQKNIESTK